MVTTRSRGNSTATLPSSSSSTPKKNRGRPRKTPPSNGDVEASSALKTVGEEIEETKVNVEEEEHNNDRGSRNKDRAQLKRQKKEQTEMLRRKVTGMGVAVPESTGGSKAESTNRKIVFDDENLNERDDDIEKVDEPIDKLTKEIPTENDDDDDDLVEVMGSSQAKDQIRFEAEKIRLAQRAGMKQKKKRKASTNLVTVDDEDAGFDDDFFQQLEDEQINNKKRKKSKSLDFDDERNQRPKHTTFVVHEAETTEDHVVDHQHNIQVVVLSHDKHALSSEPVSEMMHMYSRCGFIDPSVAPNAAINEKLLSKKDKQNTKKVASVATWTRSDKMKNILSVPSRVRRQGKPAIHFARKSR